MLPVVVSAKDVEISSDPLKNKTNLQEESLPNNVNDRRKTLVEGCDVHRLIIFFLQPECCEHGR
jgi:hypothetical protein